MANRGVATLMRDPNRELLDAAVRPLRPLLDDLVFLRGCATGLFLTEDPITQPLGQAQ